MRLIHDCADAECKDVSCIWDFNALKVCSFLSDNICYLNDEENKPRCVCYVCTSGQILDPRGRHAPATLWVGSTDQENISSKEPVECCASVNARNHYIDFKKRQGNVFAEDVYHGPVALWWNYAAGFGAYMVGEYVVDDFGATAYYYAVDGKVPKAYTRQGIKVFADTDKAKVEEWLAQQNA